MAQQNIIGSTVRRMRVDMGITQDALSARCQLAGWDMSRETLSKIEAGLRRVNDAEALMMAFVLRCEIKELFPKSHKQVISVLRHSRTV